jgi:hypothetical protein
MMPSRARAAPWHRLSFGKENRFILCLPQSKKLPYSPHRSYGPPSQKTRIRSALPVVPRCFQQVSRFLRPDETTAVSLAAVQRNGRLLREIRDVIGSPLDEHCLHASLDGRVMTLVTDSPVWSSRLRFFAPEIELGLDPRYGPISAWRIRVRPSAGERRTGPRHTLSSAAVQHLTEAAAEIADARLGAALRRLAKTGAGDR